jgi:hypothetical protein
MMTMTDEKLALLRTHRNNISRYRRLLGTRLTELERRYVERRLSEERSALERLAASTFPPAFPVAAGEAGSIAPQMLNGRGAPQEGRPAHLAYP